MNTTAELRIRVGEKSALAETTGRIDKVAHVKAQIDAGTYECDDKLDVAADRLLDDVLPMDLDNEEHEPERWDGMS